MAYCIVVANVPKEAGAERLSKAAPLSWGFEME